MTKFYDTNALLDEKEKVFDQDEVFYISSVTLEELEDIKTRRSKDESVRYSARQVIHLLDSNPDKYKVIVYNINHEQNILSHKLEVTPDTKIIACAQTLDEVLFVSYDICCRTIARDIFGLNVIGPVYNEQEDYSGYVEKSIDDNEMAYFYEHMNENVYDLLINEYLIIRDKDNNIIDSYRWDGEKHQPLYKKSIKSTYFDKLKAKDVYQSCAIDSIMNNTLTAISGKAGSGKSLLSLMCVMNMIETGRYDRLVVLYNATKTRGAADTGFYVGDQTMKALQNSIGNILITKFGDRYAVDLLMQQNKLKLVSMADCRGMEILDNEILWITESQNTTSDLIKLCLSRVSSEAKVIIEGDYEQQVDSYLYEGSNNGLKKVIDVFKDHEEFGCVKLKNVWRSKIAELCELL